MAPDQVLMDMDNDPAVGEKRKADTGKAPVNSGNNDLKNDPKKNLNRPRCAHNLGLGFLFESFFLSS